MQILLRQISPTVVRSSYRKAARSFREKLHGRFQRNPDASNTAESRSPRSPIKMYRYLQARVHTCILCSCTNKTASTLASRLHGRERRLQHSYVAATRRRKRRSRRMRIQYSALPALLFVARFFCLLLMLSASPILRANNQSLSFFLLSASTCARSNAFPLPPPDFCSVFKEVLLFPLSIVFSGLS